MSKTTKQGKKKTPRSRKKYPNLDPRYSPKVRQEYIDMDYLDQLSEDEKAWLDKFIGEHVGASFKNDDTDLHKTQKAKRAVYSSNNARNRDLYALSRAGGVLDFKEMDELEEESGNLEEAIIELIDEDSNDQNEN